MKSRGDDLQTLARAMMNRTGRSLLFNPNHSTTQRLIRLAEIPLQQERRQFGITAEKVTNILCKTDPPEREIMLFIGKPMGRSIMISNATNPLEESRKESLLRCAGSTSICVWLVCDLVVMCVQAVGDRALGDLCVCVRCGSVQSQKVCVCCNRVRHQCGSLLVKNRKQACWIRVLVVG